MSGLALWLVVALPAVAGAGLCLGGRRVERVAAPLSVAVAGVTLLLAMAVAQSRPEVSIAFILGSDFALAVDALSALVLVTVTAVTVLVLAFAAGDISESRARFHGLMLLFAAAVNVTATATTLGTLLFAWEIMGAASYALIGFFWREPGRIPAGATAFLTTRAGDLGLYAAAGAALAGGAGLGLADLPDASTGWRDVIAGGILLAALGKAAQLPFSFWLSRAMEGPSPVSALLHSAAMVAMGGYLLLRVAPLLAATGWAATTAAWVGALTALALGAVAVAQRDLKQLLAASTSAQLGFIVLAAGVSSVAGGAAHLVAHAATKALLFLAAGVWLSALGTKSLGELGGAARRWPVVGVAASVGALSLAGLAPLSLWATKDEVLAAARESSLALYVVGLAAAALSAAYAGKALVVIWKTADVGQHDGEPGLLEKAPLVVLAAGAALLGLLALPPVGDSLRGALGESSAPTSTVWELLLSAVIAIAVVAAVTRWRLPEPRWASEWLGLESATEKLVVAPVLRLSELLARFDDRVVDGTVEGMSRGSLRIGGVAARIDVHQVDGAVEALARGARRLGRLAQRPQTGQLHQYYVQVVALVGAALLLVLVVR